MTAEFLAATSGREEEGGESEQGSERAGVLKAVGLNMEVEPGFHFHEGVGGRDYEYRHSYRRHSSDRDWLFLLRQADRPQRHPTR